MHPVRAEGFDDEDYDRACQENEDDGNKIDSNSWPGFMLAVAHYLLV